MKLILGLSAIALLIPLNGYTIQTLWEWFLVPLGVVPIGLFHAYGLSLLATHMAGVSSVLTGMKREGTDKEYYNKMVTAFILPFFILLLGFIAKSLTF